MKRSKRLISRHLWQLHDQTFLVNKNPQIIFLHVVLRDYAPSKTWLKGRHIHWVYRCNSLIYEFGVWVMSFSLQSIVLQYKHAGPSAVIFPSEDFAVNHLSSENKRFMTQHNPFLYQWKPLIMRRKVCVRIILPDGSGINGVAIYLQSAINIIGWYTCIKPRYTAAFPRQWERDHCGKRDDLLPRV